MNDCTHPVLVPLPQVVLDPRQPSNLRDDEVLFSFVCLDCGELSRGRDRSGSLPLAAYDLSPGGWAKTAA